MSKIDTEVQDNAPDVNALFGDAGSGENENETMMDQDKKE